jgi:hypothetical protein
LLNPAGAAVVQAEEVALMVQASFGVVSSAAT